MTRIPIPVSNGPYNPSHRDPNDKAVDAIGRSLQPLPYRNGDGASILGPRNPAREQQDPDQVRPPTTDHGKIPNMKWSFADSHMRIEEGGWARETTVRELPSSTQLAGVNMRLDKGVIRELHWHKEAEWAYMLDGKARVTALDTEGGNYIGEVEKGDLWYFPSGFPHSIQGLGDRGCEFLLIFDNGNFSEDSTFLLSDWIAHTPRSVLSKNFRLSPEIFSHVPSSEKYIFQGSLPGSIPSETPDNDGIKRSKIVFTHRMLAQTPEKFDGGEVRITDTSVFPLSKTVSAAHVTIKPRGLREMHWHPNADEWSFFIKGRARITLFAAGGTARTFNYCAGDVGIVPRNFGHYVENISEDEDCEFLEIFRSDKFQDFSLEQWLGSTPARLVSEHLFAQDPRLGKKFTDELSAMKRPVKADP